MNRTDRLVAMVMHLQGRRVVRAEELAEHFEISLRTVYRDVAALGEAGVPVTGEAGVGYSLVKGYHLPPVMFTADEAMALFVGAEMVKQFADASLADAMDTALVRIRSVLPRDRQDDLDRLARAMTIHRSSRARSGIDQRALLPIQQAIVARRVLRMTYRARAQETDTVRDVEPLGVAFHGAWYLVAWCRLRRALRSFKLDRLQGLEVREERFEPHPEFSLRVYLSRVMAQEKMHPAKLWLAHDALERAERESHFDVRIIRRDHTGCDVELETFSLEWLARWLLSFGPNAEALEPEPLREMVRREAEAVLKKHEDQDSKSEGSSKQPTQSKFLKIGS